MIEKFKELSKKNKNYDKVLFRLFTIFCRLITGGTVSVKELAQEMNVSERTIQKDLNLRLTHLYLVRDKYGRYKLDEDFLKDFFYDIKYQILKDFFNAIAVNIICKENYKKNPKKIYDNIEKNIIVTNVDIENLEVSNDKLLLLYNACRFRQTMVIDYKFEDELIKKYTIDPYCIGLFDGYFYLLGWDRKDEIIKTFYLKNIRDIEISTKKYELSEKINKEINKFLVSNPWFSNERKSVKIKLNNNIVKFFKRNLPKNLEIIEEINGNLICNLYFYNIDEAYTFIIKWLPNITILDKESEIFKYVKKNIQLALKNL